MASYTVNKLSISLSAAEDCEGQAKQAGDPPSPIELARLALASLHSDFILYSGEIQFGHEQDLHKLLARMERKSDSVILWLTTPGGNPDAAYSMSRLLQRHYKDFSVFINGWCKSSGTLMCLGAHKLIMDSLGQLGPLDIQILNREEFGERHSGLNPIEALKAISYQSIELLRQQFLDIRFGGGLSTRQALEVATNLTGQLMSPITCQLDIMKYGEFTRSMRIANDYGTRLARAVQNANIKPEAINLLTTGYPSHGFVIDREEARDKLFSSVEDAGIELITIAQAVQTVVDKHMGSANNRALLLDLRHALDVPLADKDCAGDADQAEPSGAIENQLDNQRSTVSEHEESKADVSEELAEGQLSPDDVETEGEADTAEDTDTPAAPHSGEEESEAGDGEGRLK